MIDNVAATVILDLQTIKHKESEEEVKSVIFIDETLL